MFVGETGVRRILQRTCELMKESPDGDARKAGGIDLPTLQRYVNDWYSVSLDLFGGEISSNAANFFASGVKGRANAHRYDDHRALDQTYRMKVPDGDGFKDEDVPLRNAMNEVLRDEYAEDNQRGVDMWNKTLAAQGIDFKITLPSRRFNRQIGIFSGHTFSPEGEPVSADEFERQRDQWLPSAEDLTHVASLMRPVTEPGKIAQWIAPPKKGINSQQSDFEYVRLDPR